MEPVQSEKLLSAKEERNAALISAIETIEVEDFEIPDGFPIPLRTYIWALPVSNKDSYKTKGGLILPNTVAKNSILPHTAIVISVGPDCPEYLRQGMKILYNPHATYAVGFQGETYLKLHALNDVEAILPPETFVHPGTKDDQWIRREKRRADEDAYVGKKEAKDKNDLDVKVESSKTKIQVLPGTKGGDA